MPAERLVLVVDDDATSRTLIRTVLTGRLGCSVTEADSAVRALELVKAVKPDLIILDVLMPHLDGRDLLRHLRDQPQYRDLPVMIVSVLDEDHEVAEEVQQLGITDYVTKPLTGPDLVTRLAPLLDAMG